ncbi:Peroxidase superfamily protein [Perilla frutescens var. hirtella]|nr:Peroxidase superfamily protein [Perilla frutescens var. hirtella]KAH6810555.1 Peroxidase superfamily protein [Perilla frutescens var. frutescens]
MFAALMGSSRAQLSTDFYKKACPKVFAAVNSVVKSAVTKEKRMGASLLRLHFHDCFVQGCDGSILLDDTSSFTGEKTAGPNNNSVRGFEVIDEIKSKVEAVCPGVVSCADIVAIAARDSVVQLGGPNWEVKVGRRDSKSGSLAAANRGLPGPSFNLSDLINRFSAVGLSTKDMVVLSGAHTIGKARCATFKGRIYNETNIDPTFAKKRQANCPFTNGPRDNNLAPLDHRTPNFFDNSYFKLLLQNKGLLHSDQVLYNGGATDSLVKTYSQNDRAFDSDFVSAMIRMGGISPLTGSKGEIRNNCRKPN